MDRPQIGCMPDLILSSWPLGCDQACARMWRNEYTGHRIICECRCEHKKLALGFGKPVTNALSDNTSVKKSTSYRVIHK
jgi:hypothetical protein